MTENLGVPKVSVIMPSYNQRAFIIRAIESLRAQSMPGWELIVVDDGSTDGTAALLDMVETDRRVRVFRLEQNRGLGAAINLGLEEARAPFIAYLPADDVYFSDHLAQLCQTLDRNPQAILAFSGVRHHYNRSVEGVIDGYPLQLVQVMHRRTTERWIERDELVTDDLDRMFWRRLAEKGSLVGSKQVSCEWVDHPHQRHKIIREPVGGINLYRQTYQVTTPIRFHSSTGNFMDEVERYRRFRERPDTPLASDPLKILIVGELAYNPERILALEERGHRLFGLWMREPYWYNYVGPLPFGHVTDLPYENWRAALRDLRPDVIYALLNWQAVPFVHAVLQESGDIPFVWHFKEGPFISMEKGHWQALIDIYQGADAHIYSSPEMRDWFETVIPHAVRSHPNLILDGDLPRADWFDAPPSERLSQRDGELHTVVPGRPIGLHPHNVAELAENGIHLHFYGNFTHGQWTEWIEKSTRLAPRHLHLHPQVDQERWTTEFSQYDAGWLHFFTSQNNGELQRANWDDLNYPARIATLAMAGLPMLQRRNAGHLVATQNLAQELQIGLLFDNMAELKSQLSDRATVDRIRANVWARRPYFTFDFHADALLDFFRDVIAAKQSTNGRPTRSLASSGGAEA
ncbi:MAG TPA: glycosyltransferase [Anaerolineaceae bacterium]|nr:glycosyltransferase [Anaerolineaceae bacterium]